MNGDTSGGSTSGAPAAELLPHRPPALLVERVLDRQGDVLRCVGRLPASLANDDARLVADSTTVMMALELAAQATALWPTALGNTPAPDHVLLVSVRNATLAPRVEVDRSLVVEVESRGGAGGLRKYHCRVMPRDAPNEVLVDAELGTYIPPQRKHE